MYEDYDTLFEAPILGFWRVSKESIKDSYDSDIDDVVYFGRFLSRNSAAPVCRLEWMTGASKNPITNTPIEYLDYLVQDKELMEYFAIKTFTVCEFMCWLTTHGYRDLSKKITECAEEQLNVDRVVSKLLGGVA